LEELSDLTSHCIRCGFCLEACPTFVVTGRETESPRGRIYLARSADEGVLDWDRQVKQHIDSCLGCLACETACPSGVEYGKILEITRQRLEVAQPHRSKGMLLDGMTKPATLRAQLLLSRMLPGRRIPSVLSRLLSGQKPEADKPRPQPQRRWPPLDDRRLPPVRGEVYLLEGCVMRVLFPDVHESTRRLLRRVGYEVKESSAGCCGALHAHNGYLDEARRRAVELMVAMPDDLPVIVNAAGCGATMKHYDFLIAENEPARRFSSRVMDASEFLHREGLVHHLEGAEPLSLKVAYHDACHLAHGQGVRDAPRSLLGAIPGIELTPLPESDMCCGSAGIYNLLQPSIARRLLERKWANIVSTGAQVVVSGNPGCHAWIEQASREHGGAVRVMHTLELLEQAMASEASSTRKQGVPIATDASHGQNGL